MKKLFAIMLTVSLLFAFCSCKKSNDNISSGSFYSEPTDGSETNETDTEDILSSDTTSTDTTSTNTESEPNDTVNSEPTNDNSSNEEPTDTSSNDEPPKEEPQKPINFVPNKIGTFIPYVNEVFYNGVKYAGVRGKNNGVDCSAIVTVGNNGEYLKCISIFDAANNEQINFNICNDRIYYLQHEINDGRDYTLFNSFSVCSINLSGKDKRIEKKVDVPYTQIETVSFYLNSKYLVFTIRNLFDKANVYDVIYRYNTQTKEITNLNQRLGSHKMVFSIEEKVFVYSSDDEAIFQYDINFNNERLFFDMKNYSFLEFVENGFILKSINNDTKYLLDLSGNLSKK